MIKKNSDRVENSDFHRAWSVHHAVADLEAVKISQILPEYQERILDVSNQIAQSRLAQGRQISSPECSRRAIGELLQTKHEEVIAILFLDAKHRIISFEELFHWTIDSALVYTRVLVKRALEHNSSAIILAHNHPSGICDPSRADISITERVKDAMSSYWCALARSFRCRRWMNLLLCWAWTNLVYRFH